MAVSKTTFAQRMNRITSGNTTAWTVPGGGLASVRDERSFLRKAGLNRRIGSKAKRRNPLGYLVALSIGIGSVIAARWLEYTFTQPFAELAVVNATLALILQQVPVAFLLAAVCGAVVLFGCGLRGRACLLVQATGFIGAMVFEPDLVALAPDFYAYLYPQDWIAMMVSQASLSV